MEKNAAQKLNKKEKNNLFEIKDYENTIYELLKEQFWEESAPVNKLLKAISGSIILKKTTGPTNSPIGELNTPTKNAGWHELRPQCF